MTDAVRKKLKSPKLWAIFVAVAVGVWGLAFYWIAQPARDFAYHVGGINFVKRRAQIRSARNSLPSAKSLHACAVRGSSSTLSEYALP